MWIILGCRNKVQWVRDLTLPQLWHRSQLQLGFDPWPGWELPHAMGVAKKKKKKEEKQIKGEELKPIVIFLALGSCERG